MMFRWLHVVTAVTSLVIVSPRVDAVILFHSEARNTAPPTGELAAAGWQYQGQFLSYLGTPISSQYFITAQHIGGSVGAGFVYNGQSYVTDQMIDVPDSDLRLWRVNGTFPDWAPIYNPGIEGSEVGKRLFVVGRGTERGPGIYVDEFLGSSTPHDSPIAARAFPPQPVLKGWQWGAQDGLQSWGENTVAEVIDHPAGDLLYFTFDQTGGPNESHLSTGDSGGGVFLQTASGQWKLAGINSFVDGPFRKSAPAGDPFFAALFDAGGLFYGSSGEALPNTEFDIPTGAYASTIAGSLSFIQDAIATSAASSDVPEPVGFALVAAMSLLVRRRR